MKNNIPAFLKCIVFILICELIAFWKLLLVIIIVSICIFIFSELLIDFVCINFPFHFIYGACFGEMLSPFCLDDHHIAMKLLKYPLSDVLAFNSCYTTCQTKNYGFKIWFLEPINLATIVIGYLYVFYLYCVWHI